MNSNENNVIRPKLDLQQIAEIVAQNYGFKLINVKELNGYDDKNYHITVNSHEFKNDYISKVHQDGYVLKIINSMDSQNESLFEAQTDLLLYLNANKIICPKPILTKNKTYFNTISLKSGKHIIRLLEFIPGEILYKINNINKNTLFQVGELTGKIDNILKDFHHLAYQNDKYMQWCLSSAPDILNYLEESVLNNEKRKNLIKSTINEFKERVLQYENSFSKGIIHGDVNEQNIIIEQNNLSNKNVVSIKALIDFGDSHYCCYLYEIAIAMTYMIFQTNKIDSARDVLNGYYSIRSITEKEFKLLKICIMTRFCQSLVLGAYANLKDPNNTYVLTTAKNGWNLLEKLALEPEEKLLNFWSQN